MKRKLMLVGGCVTFLLFNAAMFMAVSTLYETGRNCHVPVAEAPTHSVVVTAVHLPAGTELSEKHLTIREVPRQFLPANPLLLEDLNIYLGQPLAQDIEAGHMVMTSDFVVAPPNPDGFELLLYFED